MHDTSTSPPSGPRWKSIGLGLGLMLGSLIVCFLLAEVAVRALYPRLSNYNMEMWRYATKIKARGDDAALPFTHGPNRSGDFYGAEIRTNAFGFRDRDYPVERVPGRRRIIFSGDSFTLGWGVAFDSIMSKLVEVNLNAQGEPTEVINLGIGNYNTPMELELFRRKGLQFQPDMVVLNYFVNDAEPTPRLVKGMSAAVLSHSYLIALVIDRFISLRPRVDKGADWKSYYSNLYRPGSPGLLATEKALQDYINLCRERGIKLVIASIPELRQLENYPFPQTTAFVRGIAERNGVPFVDFLPVFAGKDPASLWVTVEDSHANATANAMMAAELTRVIRGLNQPSGQAAAPGATKTVPRTPK